VNHSDLKSVVFKHGEENTLCHSGGRSAELFFSFGLFKVHFPALEQYRREVYLLIYIDILIGLQQCLNAGWCTYLCIGVLMQTLMYPIPASPPR